MRILPDYRKKRICLSCEHIGFARGVHKGSGFASFILWVFGLLAALFTLGLSFELPLMQ